MDDRPIRPAKKNPVFGEEEFDSSENQPKEKHMKQQSEEKPIKPISNVASNYATN